MFQSRFELRRDLLADLGAPFFHWLEARLLPAIGFGRAVDFVLALIKIDLDQSEDDVYRATEAYCREQPGFKPMEEWRAEIGKKIAAQLEA